MIFLNLFSIKIPKQQKPSDTETQQCSTSASASSQKRKKLKPKTHLKTIEDINDLFSMEFYTAASQYQVEEPVSPTQDNDPGRKTLFSWPFEVRP